MGKRLIIGIGSGRCGTLSLVHLLNRQPGCRVSHELRPLPDIESRNIQVCEKFDGILNRSEHSFCGDVAFYHLWYLRTILINYPGAKVIALKRGRTATIQSFINKIKQWPGQKPVNHWTQDRQGLAMTDFDKCFPKTNSKSLEDCICRYYDSYYNLLDVFLRLFSDQIKMVRTETFFNDPDQINSIMDWIGIGKEGRYLQNVHMINRRVNH